MSTELTETQKPLKVRPTLLPGAMVSHFAIVVMPEGVRPKSVRE
jgi:hypothetical protein